MGISRVGNLNWTTLILSLLTMYGATLPGAHSQSDTPKPKPISEQVKSCPQQYQVNQSADLIQSGPNRILQALPPDAHPLSSTSALLLSSL